MDEEHYVNDLYQDMERLNALYEELMWPHDAVLEFSADYEHNRIIISLPFSAFNSLRKVSLPKDQISRLLLKSDSRA